MTHIKTRFALGLSLGCSLLLAACGGGSGGGTTGTTPPTSGTLISSANSQEASASAYSAADSLNGQAGGSADFVTGVSVSTPSRGLIAFSLQQLYRAVENRSAPDLAVGVTTSRTMPCPYGGTSAITATIASSFSMSAGDSFTMSTNNCKMDPTTTLNGGLTMVFNTISGLPNATSAWSATFGATFSAFSVTEGAETSTANGDMTVQLAQVNAQDTSISATGNSLKIGTSQNGNRTEVTMKNYSYNSSLKAGVLSYGVNFSMSGNLPKLGAVDYVVKTSTDFKQAVTTTYPYQGVMTVTAADKSASTLTVIDGGNVSVGVDKNGDGSVDETVTTTWTALMAHL